MLSKTIFLYQINFLFYCSSHTKPNWTAHSQPGLQTQKKISGRFFANFRGIMGIVEEGNGYGISYEACACGPIKDQGDTVDPW